MVFALAVVGIESYLNSRGAGHTHSHEFWDEGDDEQPILPGHSHTPSIGLSATRFGHRPSNIALEDVSASEGLMAGVSPLPESTPTTQTVPQQQKPNGKAFTESDSDDEAESLDLELNELAPDPIQDPHTQPLTQRGRQAKAEPDPAIPHMPNAEEQQRLLLQCLLLEAGILFHSVFIGMALSVAEGPSFMVFLVAIALHQCFEGLALGSRIAAIHFPKSSLKPWLMVLAYGTTTPLGQAIGLFVHNMYDPMSQTGLLVVGFMNAISSGLLVFAGLVQLLAEDFLTEKSYKVLHGRRRIQAYMAVIGGAGLMAGVGAIA